MLALTLLYWTIVEIEPGSNTVRPKLDKNSPKSGVAVDKSTVKVFIVEDEPTTIILTEAMLSQAGYLPVGVATSFEAAMAALKVTQVDIVLVDLTLSGSKTGFDVIKELNRLNIPCVLISGTLNEQTLNKLVDLDVYGFLPKPYDSITLATTIQLALKKFTRMQDRIFDEADLIKSRILSTQAIENEFGISEKIYLVKKSSDKTKQAQFTEGLSYQRAVQWMIGLSMFFIVMAMASYFLNEPFFLTLASQGPNTKFNALLCSVLFCFSLSVENSVRLSKPWRIASIFAMAVMFILSALTLLQYLFSLNFGIDEFFLRDRFINEFNLPGRMVIPTAICFMILPLALGVNRIKTFKYRIHFTEGGALATLFFALVGAFGHIFTQIEFNTIRPYLTQSRLSIIFEALFGLGVLFLNPKKGFMSILSNQRVSAKLGRSMLFLVNASMILISVLMYYILPRGSFDNLEMVFTLVTSIIILSMVILWSTLKHIRNELQIEQTVKLLKNRERELQFILKRVPCPVAVLDRELRYVLVSRKWVENLNMQNQNIIGHSICESFPELPDKIKIMHQRALSGEIIKMADEGVMHFSGVKVIVKGEMRPWFDINDQIAGIIIFFESTTTVPQDLDQ